VQTHVTFRQEDDLGYLTFACDEPGKPATLDLVTLQELEDHIRRVQAAQGELRAVIVQSNSRKYFVVGANINALATLDAETIIPWIQRGHAVFNQLEALPLPVIARVDGYALGGGLELAMACDMIVASRGAKFGQPEAHLGFVAGWGGTFRLPRRVGSVRAKELLFTGKVIDAQQACDYGLVDFCGDPSGVDDYLSATLENVRQCSALAIAQTKALINDTSASTRQQRCLEETIASCICLSAGDTQARIRAFFASRGSEA
jgi:enoyl-CoA hydratase